ncbi:50S ribosomal protein L21 [Phyllobacterium sp. 21LDTY02-6]|uniref:50S ribosomal protein L21 n=1 Tax=Phyllobacterium sp. 21LDTY02-6 TaxID=2944903 RepID=UPI0020221DD3|nr:50S ribosomal protein L21 [Phyllobacterium sp. 21LDTY02-6]MCO4319829.1 50S ribosomal protein L21 [Phyllobacterium sp. 21LDTY02-6]
MVMFLLQSLFLIAAAFVIGAVIGRFYRHFSPGQPSAAADSTRAADARLAARGALPTAAEEVRKSAADAAAMVPPAEPVPPKPLKSPPAKRKTPQVQENRSHPRQIEANKPSLLAKARRGKADDLTLIDGIGPAIQTRLHGIGVFHFDQIASWNAEQAAWISDEIGFSGRATREKWPQQAAGFVKTIAPKATVAPKATARNAAPKAAKPRRKSTK